MNCDKQRLALLGVWILLFVSFCAAGEEVWTEVSSPNFIVISNASPKQAQKVAKSFEQFRIVLKSTMKNLNVDPGTPLIVFAADDENTLNALLAEEHREKGEAKKAGVFVHGPEWNMVALNIEYPGSQRYHVIYHEYVHMLTHLNLGRIPLWLSEGLAEFFGYATLSDKSSCVGQPSPESLNILKTKPMLPLVQLNINEDQYETRMLSPAESLASRGELLVSMNKLDRAKVLLDQSL